MGLLNSRPNRANNNNNNNNNMNCYDLNEYNNMVNAANNIVELNNINNDNYNYNYNNDDNMFCMQCQNFGTPCTCVQTEYVPCCDQEQEIIELSQPELPEYETNYMECHTPQQPAFFIPPAQPIGKNSFNH